MASASPHSAQVSHELRAMAPSRAPQVAAAYDAIAPSYDLLVDEDEWMRRVLWRRYTRLMPPGGRVLELGCGTGLDTLPLARHGAQICALDVSPGMLQQLAAKVDAESLGDRVTWYCGDAEALVPTLEGPFDLAISAFAVLNTVGDPGALAAATAQKLRPGGRMLIHLLAPSGSNAEKTATIQGHTVRHWVLGADTAYATHFAPCFRLLRRYAMGFLWPQGAKLPSPISRSLGRLEPWLGGHWPFLHRGRFVVLELEKRTGDSP